MPASRDDSLDEALEAAGLQEISTLLPLLGARVCVLHPPRGLSTQGASGGDLDCAVEGLDPLWPLRLPSPWRLIQCLHYDVTGWYWVVERDGFSLALDTLEDPAGLGKYGFPTRRAFLQEAGALQGMRAAYLTSKRLRKEIMSPAEWAHIGSLARGDHRAFTSTAEAIFGRVLTRHLALAVDQGLPPSPRIRRRARLVVLYKRFRNPWRAGRLLARACGRVAERLRHPTGLIVVVAGPDGAGKSTVAAMLPELSAGGFRRTMHLHWRPQVLPRAGALVGSAAGDPTKPHSRPPRGTLPALAALLYYWADFFIGSWIKLIPARFRSGLIVVERGWWDIAVDPRRYRMRGPATLIKALGRLLPAPDLVLVLEAPPETLADRKGELSLQEATRQIEAWGRVIPSSIRRSHLDATRPLQDVFGAAREEILKLLEEKALSRLDAGWVGLPRRSSPRWTLPRGPGRVATAGVHVYQPVTLRGRLGWEAARALGRIGGFRLMPRGQPPPPAVRAAVAPHLPPQGTVSVLRANHPGRYLALIISREGKCIAVAKVATDETGRAQLKREAEALTKAGSLLTGHLACPRILGAEDGLLLLEAVQWKPRFRPWLLPVDVASSLGALFRSTASREGHLSIAHGDCAPWNLLESASGWALVDWEESRADAPPFFDLFHYVVQSHVLLGRPRASGLLDGINEGRGWIAAAIQAYAEAAGLPVESATTFFPTYLEKSIEGLDESTREGRAGLSARRALLAATGR